MGFVLRTKLRIVKENPLGCSQITTFQNDKKYSDEFKSLRYFFKNVKDSFEA